MIATPDPTSCSEASTTVTSSTARPCIDCQRPTRNGTRCEPCRRTHETAARLRRGGGGREAQGYGYEWRKLVAAKVAEQPYCTYMAHPYAATCTPFDDLSLDHVIPRSRGGTDDDSNLVVACIHCNSAKRDRG